MEDKTEKLTSDFRKIYSFPEQIDYAKTWKRVNTISHFDPEHSMK